MIERRHLHDGWEFREAGTGPWRPATVPGCVQLDLLALGEVPDPFFRMNEVEMHGLEDRDWEYRTSFAPTSQELDSDAIVLVFEGIDTYADIYLNDLYLGSTANMFVPHRLDITGVVRRGRNELLVRMPSITRTARAIERDSPLTLRTSTESARPYVRKAQYGFGWDWGPRIVQTGIWRPVRLEIVREARVVDPYAYTASLDGTRATVHIQANVDDWTEEPLVAEVTLRLGEREVASQSVPVRPRRDIPGFEARLTVEDAQLWWPNGLGAQPLYTATVVLLSEGEPLDELSFRFGIRTVELLRERDAEGETFILAINGVRVFAKGANWIPADSLLPRLTRDDYYALVRLAADAHMNMLRIWGGGIYEDPAFYEACDEMGVMVWQDFMYSCAQYPDELEWFREQATDEAEDVVLALRNHPSIVLWCGNNENNWGFDEWWDSGVPRYLGNTVYREILPEVCSRIDPSRPYWVSSPYGGEHPNSMEEGDRHQWTVWSNWRDFDGYLEDTGRFISEFGFQAMPAWRTLLAYTAPEDRHLLSPVMRSHNKMVEGTERLLRFVAGRLGLPRDLKSFVYLTQLNQAEAIRTGVEHWRRRMFRTAGALYWQLNDCWPVASWSALDYYRRKKALYHYSRAFFAPLLPTLALEGDEVVLYGVSDLLQSAEAEVRVASHQLDGNLRAEHTARVTVLPNRSAPLLRYTLADLGVGYRSEVVPRDALGTTVPREVNGDLLDTVVYVELTAEGITYRNYLVFDRFRQLDLREPHVRVDVDGTRVTLTAQAPAFGVFLETENDVDVSDNCLYLEPGRPVTVECSADPGAVSVIDLTAMVAPL